MLIYNRASTQDLHGRSALVVCSEQRYMISDDMRKDIKLTQLDLVVTCFPGRWDHQTRDPLNVLDGIMEEMNAKTRPAVRSAYDLAILISSRCSGSESRCVLLACSICLTVLHLQFDSNSSCHYSVLTAQIRRPELSVSRYV